MTQVQRDIHIRERVFVCEKNSQIFTLHHHYLNSLSNKWVLSKDKEMTADMSAEATAPLKAFICGACSGHQAVQPLETKGCCKEFTWALDLFFFSAMKAWVMLQDFPGRLLVLPVRDHKTTFSLMIIFGRGEIKTRPSQVWAVAFKPCAGSVFPVRREDKQVEWLEKESPSIFFFLLLM